MYDFSTLVNRKGTWSTQWDYIKDRFGRSDLLPFTISDMDFKTAPCIISALQERLAHGVLGYSRWRHPEFLSAVSHWYQQRFSCQIDEETLVYGPSVIYMVSQFIQMWSKPGDKVVVHTPAYDAFYKVIESTQRQLLSCPLSLHEGKWQVDFTQFEQCLQQDNVKVLLLCSPHNPTGKTWTKAELTHMARLCQCYGVKVISDEIHMDMVWGDRQHTPWSTVATTPWALLTSASKSFNIPALTGAYGMVGDEVDREHYLTLLKSRDALSSPAVMAIIAHIAAYQHGLPWLTELRDYLYENQKYVVDTLNSAFPQLALSVSEATYLAWLDLRPLHKNDRQLQDNLVNVQKVAIMPGFTYGSEGEGFLRLNVGCPRSKVEDGVKRLIHALHQCK